MRRATLLLAFLVTGCGTGAAAVPSPSASSVALPPLASVMPSASASSGSGLIVVAVDDVNLAITQRQLYIENADGTDQHRLVTSTADDNAPVISPDGHTVLFDRIPLGDAGGPSKSFLVDVDGGNLRELDPGGCATPCVAEDVEGDAWSPDGRSVVLTRVEGDREGKLASIGLVIIDVATGALRTLTRHTPADLLEDHHGGWSPDGKHIVFQRIDNALTSQRSTLFSFDLDADQELQLMPWTVNAGDPAWSPDGGLIAFQSPSEAFEQDGEQNIYVVKPDGTGRQQLTAHLGLNSDGREATIHPSWSPDGAQIAFGHAPASGNVGDLFVMDRDGGNLHALAETPTINELGPDWGPAP